MTTAPYEVGILKRWVYGYRRHLPDQHDIVLCARLYLLSFNGQRFCIQACAASGVVTFLAELKCIAIRTHTELYCCCHVDHTVPAYADMLYNNIITSQDHALDNLAKLVYEYHVSRLTCP